jgi:type III secretory pathway component EscT
MPVALAAAVPLWAATMAGGLVDSLRGAQEGSGLAVVEGRASSFGVLLSLVASLVFLSSGGPARVASALGTAALATEPLLAAANALVAGIGLAVAIGGPLLAAAVILEIAFAFIARAASPAQVHALFAPLRALGLLAIAAVVLERISALLALGVRNAG